MSEEIARILGVPAVDWATQRPLNVRLAGSAPVSFGNLVARFSAGDIDGRPGAPDWSRSPSGAFAARLVLDDRGTFSTPWLRGFPTGTSIDVVVTVPRALAPGESLEIELEAELIPLGNASAVAGVVPEIPRPEIADRYPNAVSGFRLWRAAKAAARTGG